MRSVDFNKPSLRSCCEVLTVHYRFHDFSPCSTTLRASCLLPRACSDVHRTHILPAVHVITTFLLEISDQPRCLPRNCLCWQHASPIPQRGICHPLSCSKHCCCKKLLVSSSEDRPGLLINKHARTVVRIRKQLFCF